MKVLIEVIKIVIIVIVIIIIIFILLLLDLDMKQNIFYSVGCDYKEDIKDVDVDFLKKGFYRYKISLNILKFMKIEIIVYLESGYVSIMYGKKKIFVKKVKIDNSFNGRFGLLENVIFIILKELLYDRQVLGFMSKLRFLIKYIYLGN